MNYEIWGQSELIEKLENGDFFASEVVKHFQNKKSLTVEERYLEEMARKLSGDKIKSYV